jgi:Zn-dependent protease
LVPAAIGYFAWQPGYGMNWAAAGWWSLVSLLLFSFILVHELGHALVARDRGVVAERIILFPLGGGAYLPDRPEQTWAEVLVYAAGPLANIFLALLAWIALLLRPDGELLIAYFLRLSGNLVVFPGLLDQVLGLTLSVNLLLALGNLLPAYPLDGGRILRALLRKPAGERPATVIVTVLGVLIGLVLVVVGYRLGDPLLMAGAVFISGLSVMEYRSGWQRRRLAKRWVPEVIRQPRQEKLYLGQTVGEAKQQFAQTDWPVLPVFNRWNEHLGFVDLDVLEAETEDDAATLHAFAETEFVAASPDEDLLTVTERIVAANVYGAIIYDNNRQVTGYVFTHDVMRLLGRWYDRFRRK